MASAMCLLTLATYKPKKEGTMGSTITAILNDEAARTPQAVEGVLQTINELTQPWLATDEL